MVIKQVLSDFKKSDNTRRVHIYLYSEGKKTFIRTPHFVKESDWDRGVIKGKPNADYINGSLKNIVNGLENLWLQSKCSVYELKDFYEKPDKEPVGISDFIDKYVADIKSGVLLNHGKPFAKGSVRGIKLYTGYFKKYAIEHRLSWDRVDDGFLDSYITHLRSLDFKDNTITRCIKMVKVVMKKSMKAGLHSNASYVDFKATYQDVDTIALTPGEMALILKAKLDNHLKVERDRFYLSYNLLLRFGDSIDLDKRDIRKKGGKVFVSLMHEKTKTTVVIPLFPESLAILKKYNYKLPPTSNYEANWKLKDIGKAAKITTPHTITTVNAGKIVKQTLPKYKFITTHTARRSMATNLYLAGFDLKEIQLMGGWRSMAVLEKYLKIDKLQNAIKAGAHPFFN